MSANGKKAPITGSRTAREAQEQKEARRSNIMYGTIAVLFVLLAVTVFVWKSNIIQNTAAKNATAATVYLTSADVDAAASSSAEGDKTAVADISVAEVSYYFQNVYQNFMRQYGQYASYFGLDTAKPLRDQPYGEDGETWFDNFMDQALTQLAAVTAMNAAAAEEGFTWNDEMQSDFDGAQESLKAGAAGANLSVKKYLHQAYGATMTEGVYETQLKNAILAGAYAQQYNDGLTYSPADLSAAYQADTKSYDVVDYRSVRIDGAAESTTDAEGNPVEPTEAESAAAMAAAKSAAEAILADSQTSLEDAAEASDKADYTDGKAKAYSSSALMDWLFDDARKSGDIAVIADEDGAAYYVAIFSDRYRQEYSTIDVRHILIKPEAGTLAAEDAGYEEEQAQLKADAKAKAEELLAQWQSGEATEDSFAALAKENTADSNGEQGGLYEQVSQGQMVATFNDWCFDSTRKSGDTGVVETDYGYHVMYFVGTNAPYWQVQVDTTLRNADYEEWYAGITAAYTAEAQDGAQYLG